MPLRRSRRLATIVDYFNEDCFRILFNYVPIEDIIRSERVSRAWQRVVQRYLGSVRICIEGPKDDESKQKDTFNNRCRYTLSQSHCESFKSWTRKLGCSIVAVYCTSEESWEIYKENCPNLESITFAKLEYSLPLSDANSNFKHLRRLRLENCEMESEETIEQYLNNTSLEELVIEENYTVTGACFKNIRSNLKSLDLYYCLDLDLSLFQSAVDSFRSLTTLFMLGGFTEVYEQLSVMLPKMLKLESLFVHTDGDAEMNCDSFIESVCQLGGLKDLDVNCMASDAHLDAVTRCCKELHSLRLGVCVDAVVTGRGVEAVCRNAGDRLVSFGISCADQLTDEDVITCVRYCPNLKCLEVRGCRGLSVRALAGADAARAALRPRAPPLVFRAHFAAPDRRHNPFPYLKYESDYS